MYGVTESIVGTAGFAVTLGVRPDSPTSSLLFVLYVDELIWLIKYNCEDDSFLKWLHVLILMNDTVQFSTSRERMINKLSHMKWFCSEYGMKVNELNTFFLIHGTPENNEPIHKDGLVVERCAHYVCVPGLPVHCRCLSIVVSQSSCRCQDASRPQLCVLFK